MQHVAEATDVDVVISNVLPVVDALLFGEPAEARAAKQFSSKYREAKHTKSKDTFQLLCHMSTFQTNSPLMTFIEGTPNLRLQ